MVKLRVLLLLLVGAALCVFCAAPAFAQSDGPDSTSAQPWKQRVEPTLLAAYEAVYGSGVPDSTVVSVAATLIRQEGRMTAFIADLIAREYAIRGLGACIQEPTVVRSPEDECAPEVTGMVVFDLEHSPDVEELRALGIRVGATTRPFASVRLPLSLLDELASTPGIRTIAASAIHRDRGPFDPPVIRGDG